MAVKLWECRKCGHEVVAEQKPQPIRWTDGHVCYFSEKKEDDAQAQGKEGGKDEG